MNGFLKIVRVLQGEDEADRKTLYLLAIPCVDDDHKFHLFKEVTAGFDNSPDWSCASSSEGFREYRNRDYRSEFLAVYLIHDNNPEWEPDITSC